MLASPVVAHLKDKGKPGAGERNNNSLVLRESYSRKVLEQHPITDSRQQSGHGSSSHSGGGGGVAVYRGNWLQVGSSVIRVVRSWDKNVGSY